MVENEARANKSLKSLKSLVLFDISCFDMKFYLLMSTSDVDQGTRCERDREVSSEDFGTRVLGKVR